MWTPEALTKHAEALLSAVADIPVSPGCLFDARPPGFDFVNFVELGLDRCPHPLAWLTAETFEALRLAGGDVVSHTFADGLWSRVTLDVSIGSRTIRLCSDRLEKAAT